MDMNSPKFKTFEYLFILVIVAFVVFGIIVFMSKDTPEEKAEIISEASPVAEAALSAIEKAIE